MDNVEPGKERERITDGNNGQHVWCSRIMTGTRANGKKTHGVGLFGMHQGEERRNLCWKSGCSLTLTNDGKGYLRGVAKIGGRPYPVGTKLEVHRSRQVGCDSLGEMDSEGGVESDGDNVGARSSS